MRCLFCTQNSIRFTSAPVSSQIIHSLGHYHKYLKSAHKPRPADNQYISIQTSPRQCGDESYVVCQHSARLTRNLSWLTYFFHGISPMQVSVDSHDGLITIAVTVRANTIATKTATDVVNFMVSGMVWVEYWKLCMMVKNLAMLFLYAHYTTGHRPTVGKTQASTVSADAMSLTHLKWTSCFESMCFESRTCYVYHDTSSNAFLA